MAQQHNGGKYKMELNFKLSQVEAQQILNVLAKQPYDQVFEVIGKIQQQANEQIQEKVETEEK